MLELLRWLLLDKLMEVVDGPVGVCGEVEDGGGISNPLGEEDGGPFAAPMAGGSVASNDEASEERPPSPSAAPRHVVTGEGTPPIQIDPCASCRVSRHRTRHMVVLAVVAPDAAERDGEEGEAVSELVKQLGDLESDSVALDLKQHLNKLDIRRIKNEYISPRSGPFSEERNQDIFKVSPARPSLNGHDRHAMCCCCGLRM